MTLVAVQIQLSEIKGILSTVVGEHSRRITDTESANRQLRIDLTAVKDEGQQALTMAINAVNQRFNDNAEKGNAVLREVDGKINTNTNNIIDLKADVQEVKDKQNATLGKTVMILSPIIATAALAWNMIGGKV